MDLVNLRLLDDGTGPTVPLAEQLGELEDMRKEGKLDLIGVSNVTRRAGRAGASELVDVGEVQNAYSILDREHEPLLELCREHEVAFVPFFPLGSAFTGGPAKLAEDPAIAAGRASATARPRARSRWPGCSPATSGSLLIPGTSSVAHLEENMAAGDVELDAEDLAQLDAVQPPVSASPDHR